MTTRSGTPRVFLHIGPPKTGTTFLQTTLRHWQRELETCGITLPGGVPYDHFFAALDARGERGFGYGTGGDARLVRAVGAWPRLVRQTKRASGTVVISHELFATADVAHARAAVEDLDGTDLHLVVTARDPERQLMSSWQQQIKNGKTRTFRSLASGASAQRLFRRPQRLPELVERWASTLPPDHVHIVTVPPAGSDPVLLWQRFAEVVGIDAARFGVPDEPETNQTLGAAQVELLRRVNVALDGRIPHPLFDRVVTHLYAEGLLAGQAESASPALPPRLWPTVDAVAAEWIERLEASGYDVTGDLEDLRPAHRRGAHPGAATGDELTQAAVLATAELLMEIARRDRWQSIPRRGVAWTRRTLGRPTL